jgi:hypothetical protein
MARTSGQILKVALYIITVAYIITCVIWVLRAYGVYSADAHGTPIHDGLGRPLFPAPWYYRFFLGADAHWAGAKWFWRENLVFWTSNIVLFVLHSITNAFSEASAGRKE